MICLDINQGCVGFIIGLQQAFMLLEQDSINKVLLINGDVLGHKVSKRDRNSYPLIGDAVSITIIEKSTLNSEILLKLKMDGSRNNALTIPAGAFRMPSNSETAELKEDVNGNFRSLDNLVMQGDAVFNFVMTDVPPMIEDLLSELKLSKEEIDYFMFHQPNKFMLQKLAEKLAVPYEKMPNNVVENYGNSSGATIPTTICHNIADDICKKEMKICFAGFGVGLTWATLVMDVGPFEFCNFIKYND
jgi:3-oxoacyl-[acyl-carrier-protein] synthase-3